LIAVTAFFDYARYKRGAAYRQNDGSEMRAVMCGVSAV